MDLLEYINSYRGFDGEGYGGVHCFGSGGGYGDGCGKGRGDGNGEGRGDSNGCEYYNGNSCGSGSGRGFGNGNDSGIIEYEGVKGYCIDDVQTFLESIKYNIGKGFTQKRDCKKEPCYVYLTDDGFIAHGRNAAKNPPAT